MTDQGKRKNKRYRQSFLFSLLFLSLVIAVGFACRVVKLSELPLSLSLDEATNGLDALQLLRLKWLTPFLQNNFGRETLFFYLQGIVLWLYGISFFALRFASVLVGTLTLPLLYIVGRRLQLDSLPFSPDKKPHLQTISLLATTGLAVSYWHIYFSRLSLRAILLPPLVLTMVWCFWRGWYGRRHRIEARRSGGALLFRQKRRFWLIAAGFLCGLAFNTYLAARLLPLLFIIFIAIDWVSHKSARKEKLVDFLIFSLTAILPVVPLIIYFYQNPQSLSSRTQALSLIATGNPLQTLRDNFIALLQIHFGAGTWLGEWPALNMLSALGLFIGLLVCLYRLRRPACLFLLLWWLIGTAPVLISRQDWTGTTTLLRGILAWPALFIMAAIGLVSLLRWVQQVSRWRNAHLFSTSAIEILLPFLLLMVGGVSSAHNYFSVWATMYNRFSDHPAYMAQYLNRQTRQLTLVPLKFYGETVGNFLVQARYPQLTNIDPSDLPDLLASDRPAVYLMPADSPQESIFVLLVPAANNQGTAYLLPPFSPAQVEALASHSQIQSPLATVLDSEQEAIAHVFPLTSDSPFLPLTAPRSASPHPLQANFDDDVLLRDYQIEPAVLKPGETVTLALNWQAQRPIDGDPYLFIHLLHIPTGQRFNQVNTPLTGVLFDAHRWPVGLKIPGIYYFTLPADAPEGAYRFEVGLYHGASLERLPVSLAPDQPVEAGDDKIMLGKLHVRQQPLTLPQYPLDSDGQFGDSIALLGVDVDLPATSIRPGQILTYQLHWQALAPITQDYVVFTHLLNPDGNIQAQQDNPPQQGRYPTSWWDPAEIVVDSYHLTLPENLAPGQYTLRVGLYEPKTGQRLPLKNQAQDFVDFPNLITVE